MADLRIDAEPPRRAAASTTRVEVVVPDVEALRALTVAPGIRASAVEVRTDEGDRDAQRSTPGSPCTTSSPTWAGRRCGRRGCPSPGLGTTGIDVRVHNPVGLVLDGSPRRPTWPTWTRARSRGCRCRACRSPTTPPAACRSRSTASCSAGPRSTRSAAMTAAVGLGGHGDPAAGHGRARGRPGGPAARGRRPRAGAGAARLRGRPERPATCGSRLRAGRRRHGLRRRPQRGRRGRRAASSS